LTSKRRKSPAERDGTCATSLRAPRCIPFFNRTHPITRDVCATRGAAKGHGFSRAVKGHDFSRAVKRSQSDSFGASAPAGRERARIHPCHEVGDKLFSCSLQALPGASAAKAGEGGDCVTRRCGTTKVLPFPPGQRSGSRALSQVAASLRGACPLRLAWMGHPANLRFCERARIYPCHEVGDKLVSCGLQALPGASAAKAGEGGIVTRCCGTTKVVPFRKSRPGCRSTGPFRLGWMRQAAVSLIQPDRW
jgi:hypothetical protein